MIVGLAMLLLLQTNANFLMFSMSNCVASFIIGTVLFAAGLYGKVGSAAQAHAVEAQRHGSTPPSLGADQLILELVGARRCERYDSRIPMQ